MYFKKNINKKGLTLIELIISIMVLSIFLLSTYSAINNSYGVIGYIDSNINGLNMSKSLIDETVNIRDTYLENYPYSGREEFIKYYGLGYFKLSKEKCKITDESSKLYLCPIQNLKEEYEGPLDNLGLTISGSTTGVSFYRKLEVREENKFYLKNIDREKTLSGELLILKFTDKVYNNNSLTLYGNFDNSNIFLTNSGLSINYFNIDGNSGSDTFSNINNDNLRYSKIIEYNSGSTISNSDSIILSFSGQTYTFDFVDTIPTSSSGGIIPIKIETDIHKNYYNLCNEFNKLQIINCNFNYFLKENFYEKLIGTEKEISNIDFGDDYSFSFSGANDNEILINIIGTPIPESNTLTYLNPYGKIKHNENDLSNNDFLSIISDSTSGRGIEIPDLPSIIGEINTNTGYTSLLNIKATTLLYDGNKFIDTFIIESKIGNINRYPNNNE